MNIVPDTRTPSLQAPIDFARLVELQSALNQAENVLILQEARVNTAINAVIDEARAEWVTAKLQHAEAVEEIKRLAELHPEWREGKTVKTPFGTVQLRDSSSLEIPNPAGTLALIRATFPKLGLDPELYIEVTEIPKKEILETLTDLELANIGVLRETTTSITVKPARTDMAKATKSRKNKSLPAAVAPELN